MADYTMLDTPVLLRNLFYPRRDSYQGPEGCFDHLVSVASEVAVHCRYYPVEQGAPWILYFHGNGEVVCDYDDLAVLYNDLGINLVVADYRGYGASTGNPSLQSMVEDAHKVFVAVEAKLNAQGNTAGLWIMGRSLGSMSALELVGHYQDRVKGVIIESGFACISRLIKAFELPADRDVLETLEQECLDMIKTITIPALVIHGEWDGLVNPQEGRLVFDTLGSKEKYLCMIDRADHNNVIVLDRKTYFGAIERFVKG